MARRLLVLRKPMTDIPRSRGFQVFGIKWGLALAGGPQQLHKYIDKRHRQLGPVFRESLGAGVDGIFISDSEYMRQVFRTEGKCPVHLVPEAWTIYNMKFGTSRGLFFMNGEEWLHYRRIMNNLLFKSEQTYIEEACTTVAMHFVDGLTSSNLDTSLYQWSLRTLIAILLGSECYKSQHYDLTRLSQEIKKIFETSVSLELLPVRKAAENNWKPWRDFAESVDGALGGATELVSKLIQVRKGEGLLDRMLEAEMTKNDVIRIIVDLILAAGDTTAYTMQWCLYNLAKHAELQNKVHVKLKYDLPTKPEALRHFVKETLRLYPVAPFITRVVTQPVQIGPYHISPGNILILSLYTSGRSATVFPDPNKFDPERWSQRTPEMQKASLHFAMGARPCIGRKIAEKQLETTLEHIIRKFHVQLQDDSEEIEMIMRMVAVPSKLLKLKLTPRRI